VTVGEVVVVTIDEDVVTIDEDVVTIDEDVVGTQEQTELYAEELAPHTDVN
jgi:hypothetical protein